MLRFFRHCASAALLATVASPLLILLTLFLLNTGQEAPAGTQRIDPGVTGIDQGDPARPPQPADPATVQEFDMPPGHSLGESVEIEDLTLCAVNSEDAGGETEFLTLDEAMESGVCEIHEVEDVNRLLAIVTTDQPVLGLAGDLLLGGQQDRILASSVVLERGRTYLDAFCVEQGRWEPQVEEDPEVGSEGRRFYKNEHRPQADLSVKRAAVTTGSQGEVWNSVASVNAQVEAPDPNGTGSYRRAFDSAALAKLDDLVRRARDVISESTVGFAVLRGDELIAADVFENHALLQKVSDKLLRSYAMTGLHGHWAARVPEQTYVNEDPSDMPSADLAEDPNEDLSGSESPRPNRVSTTSAVGLAGGVGGGGGRGRNTDEGMASMPSAPPQPQGLQRYECRREGSPRPAHIGIIRR